MNVRPDRSFDGDSAVAAYWLSRCEGFSVRAGRRDLGVVQEVTCSEPIGLARSLVVRGTRVRHIDPADVVAVIPAKQVLVVRPRRRAPSGSELMTRAKPVASNGTRHLLEASRVALAMIPSAATWIAATLETAARRLRPIVVRETRRAADAASRGAVVGVRAAAAGTRQTLVVSRRGLGRARRRGGAAVAAWRAAKHPEQPPHDAGSAIEPAP